MTKVFADSLGAFFSTTLDDLLVLVYLFLDKSTDPSIKYPYLRIVIGQVIGFTIIVGIGLIGLLLETEIPIQYITLLGIIPLIFGLKTFVEAIASDCYASESDAKESTPILENQSNYKTEQRDPELPELYPGEEAPFVEEGDRILLNSENSNDSSKNSEDEENYLVKILAPIVRVILDPLIAESTILSLMCGSDNIVIYTTLFATEPVHRVLLTILIFYVLLMFNAGIAFVIVKSPLVVSIFDNYSKYVIALLLVGLGLDILSDSVLWPPYN